MSFLFVLVRTVEKEDKSLFSKRFSLNIIKGIGYGYTVIQLKRPSLINSRRILSLIGNRPVLMTEEIASLAKKKLNCINKNEYEKRIFENGVKILLDGVKSSSATLIDFKCKYQAIADILLKSFKTVRIITSSEQLYKAYVDEKLYECGAIVTISNKLKLSDDTRLCVSPSGIVFDSMNLSDIPIITTKRVPFLRAPIIHSFSPGVKGEHKKEIPEGIDYKDYMSALYYHCGLREKSIVIPSFAYMNECKESIDKIKIKLFAIDSQ